MTLFEENLWESVLEIHGEDLADTQSAVSPGSGRRPHLIIAATGATAVAAVAGTLALTSSPPAYAVTRQHDGAVLVKVTTPAAVRPANAKLAAMGVPAYLVAVPHGRTVVCAPGAAAKNATVRPVGPLAGPRASAPPEPGAPASVLIPLVTPPKGAPAPQAGAAKPRVGVPAPKAGTIKPRVGGGFAPKAGTATPRAGTAPKPTGTVKPRAGAPTPPAVTATTSSTRPARVTPAVTPPTPATAGGPLHIVACLAKRR